MRAAYNTMAGIGVVPSFLLLGAVVGGGMPLLRGGSVGSVLWAAGSGALMGSLLGALLLLAVPAVGRWLIERRSPDWQTLTLSVASEQLRIDGFGRSTVAPFASVKRVKERDGLYLLVLANGAVHFLPKRVLEQAGLSEQFRALLVAHQGKLAAGLAR